MNYWKLFLYLIIFASSSIKAQQAEFIIQDGHSTDITALAVRDNEFASIDASGKLIIWDANSTMIKEKHYLPNLPYAGVRSQRLTFLPSSNKVFFNTHNFRTFNYENSLGGLLLYDLNKNELQNKFKLESDVIYGKNGNYYFYVNEYYSNTKAPNNVSIFKKAYLFHYVVDENKKTTLKHQYSFDQRITNFTVSADDKYIATGFKNGEVSLLEISTFEVLWKSNDFEDQIFDLTFISKSNDLAFAGTAKKYSSSAANYIIIRNTSGKLIEKYISEDKEDHLDIVCASDDGKYLIATGAFKIHVLGTSNYKPIHIDHVSGKYMNFHQVSAIEFLKNSHQAIVSSSQQLRIFDVDDLIFSDNINTPMAGFSGKMGFYDNTTYYLSGSVLEFYDLIKLEKKEFNLSIVTNLIREHNEQEKLNLWYPLFIGGNYISFNAADSLLAVWTTPSQSNDKSENHVLSINVNDLTLTQDYILKWDKEQQEKYIDLQLLCPKLNLVFFTGKTSYKNRQTPITTLFALRLDNGKEVFSTPISRVTDGFKISSNKKYLTLIDDQNELKVYKTNSFKEVFSQKLNYGVNNTPYLFHSTDLVFSNQLITDSSRTVYIMKRNLNENSQDTLAVFGGNDVSCMDYDGKHLAVGLSYDFSLNKWKDSVDIKTEKLGFEYFVDYTMQVFNLETDELVKKVKGEISFFNSCILHDDLLLTNQLGQHLHIVPLYKKGYINQYRVNNEDIYLSNGYYKSTKPALKHIGLRYGNNAYPIDNFDLIYNRPDKVLANTSKSPNSLLKAYHQAWQKRLQISQVDTNNLDERFTPDKLPISKITNRKAIKAVVLTKLLTIDLSFIDSNRKLKYWQIKVNGVPVFAGEGQSIETAAGVWKKISYDLGLSEGINQIRVYVENEFRQKSLPEQLTITYTPKQPSKPNLYIVTIGVSVYQNPDFNLQYAAKDARDLQELFSEYDTTYYDDGQSYTTTNYSFKKDMYNKIFRIVLSNKEATKEKLKAIKDVLSKSTVDDIVMVFISGHGLLNKEGNYYFATYDMDFSDPQKNGFSFKEITRLFDGIAARKRLLFLDTCHSGEIDNTDNSTKTILAGMEEKEVTSSFTKGAYVIQQENEEFYGSYDLMKDLFADLNSSGIIITSASSGLGYAIENKEYQNGVFTYAILRGLKDNLADENKDSKIQVSELRKYIISQVFSLTNGAQKPTSRQENVEFDFRVW
ncbi:MAG: hypothetical protein HN600_18370 [Bacteroidetes bacterium]|nr:hypothetical protein [Bacteroidota bacterium]